MAPLFTSILCADWSRKPKGREVYLADTLNRRIFREASIGGWTVDTVLARARALKANGPTLVAFDAPLGLPMGYFRAVKDGSSRYRSCKTFVDWLVIAGKSDRLFKAVDNLDSWSVDQPFFALPAGTGSRRRWEAHLAESGIDALRSIDRLTKAKPLFIVSGIPGSVGSAACDLWRGLLPFLGRKEPEIAIWPFQGDLDELSQSGSIVVGEIYPRAAYAAALASEEPADRAPLDLAKNTPDVRYAAIRAITTATWVQDHSVKIEDLNEAQESADAFDALFTAAALLRCSLEGTPFSASGHENVLSEGGILGAGSIDLGKPARRFPPAALRLRAKRVAPGSGKSLPCPIPKCLKVFYGSRSGWDAHVASVGNHKKWRPGVTNPEQRKQLFRRLFARFFE